MLRTVDVLNEYQYMLSNIPVSIAGSTEKYTILASNVRQINITNLYSSNIIPIIQVSAAVEPNLYKLLTKSEADISMTIVLHKYNSTSTLKARELVFSNTFGVLNEYDMQTNEMEMLTTNKVDNADDTISGINTNQLVDASFYLIDKDRLTKYRKIKSHFITGASITDAIALLFTERGFKSLLMNKIPDDTIRDIYLPAYNLMASIEFLNNRYGLFYTDYIFYMDIVETYLLDKKNLGVAVREGKPSAVKMYIENYKSVESAATGSALENNAYIVNIAKTPTVMKLDSYVPFIEGTNILGIDTNNNKIPLPGDLDKALQVFNGKTPRQLQHATKETKLGVTVGAVSVDIGLIAPNLKYTLIVNSAYDSINHIAGDYRLNSSVISLTKSATADFGIATSMDLVRIS